MLKFLKLSITNFLALILLLLLTSLVFASPGRLNSNGCHNGKTEGYHCHRFTSSSDNIGTTPSTYTDSPTTITAPVIKKAIGIPCTQNNECQSNYCVRSKCSSSAYNLGDSICDYITGEQCTISNDCICNSNQTCNTTRLGSHQNGCYTITCGDGYVDSGEDENTCCVDSACPEIESSFKYNICNQKSQKCEMEPQLWVKATILGSLVFGGFYTYNYLEKRRK